MAAAAEAQEISSETAAEARKIAAGKAAARAWSALRARPALLAAVASVALIELFTNGLDTQARRALQVFVLAIVGWTLTRLDDAYVAMLAALGMAAFALDEPDEMFEALGHDLIWLMFSAFVLAAALRTTGLSDRLASLALARAKTTRGAFHALSAAMLASAFLVPSTSGRAAMMVPVHEGLARARPELAKALALLFPTVILLSAFASLTGAGAHVLAAELVDEIGDVGIGFVHWALYGLPFAAACTFLSAEAALRLFVPRDLHAAAFSAADPLEKLSPQAGRVLAVFGLVVVGWLTKPLHEIDETVVALIGAAAAVAPGVSGLDFRSAVRSVEWPLMLFMAATIVIAEGLDDAGVIKALAKTLFEPLGEWGLPPLVFLVALAGFGLVSHLVIHSRTARVAVLLPPALAAAKAADVDPLAAMRTLVAATGFCQLLMVSAKPVALFGALGSDKLGGGAFGQRDLLRLGAVLMPLQLALVALFAGLVWPLLGLDLAN